MKQEEKKNIKSKSSLKAPELKMDPPISEKDEIKQAEDKMRKKLKF